MQQACTQKQNKEPIRNIGRLSGNFLFNERNPGVAAEKLKSILNFRKMEVMNYADYSNQSDSRNTKEIPIMNIPILYTTDYSICTHTEKIDL